MNQRVLSLIVALTTPVVSASPVTNLVLNPREVITVPVATDRLSTIYFPSPLAHLEAAYVSTEADPPARFQLSFRPGNSFFSLRALGTNLSASLNVVWKTNVYVFELVSSAQPTLSITLVEAAQREVLNGNRRPAPHRLFGILDTAKSYVLLRSQHPAVVSDVQYSPRRERYGFGHYEMMLEEVFRFQSEDTLVFKVILQNKTGTPLRYLPQSFRVRVGEGTYPAAIAEGDGVVPGFARVPLYFAVSSDAVGSKASLSVANDFLVLLTVPGLQPLPAPTRPTPRP